MLAGDSPNFKATNHTLSGEKIGFKNSRVTPNHCMPSFTLTMQNTQMKNFGYLKNFVFPISVAYVNP